LTNTLLTSIDHSFAFVFSTPEICHWRSVGAHRCSTVLKIVPVKKLTP
jgi:hypothetical protein